MITQEKDASLQEAKRERSTAYPGINLERAVEVLEDVVKNLGKGPFDRESIARASGFNGVTGTSSSVIGALGHFGLLDRQGNSYSCSELGSRILTPLDATEKQLALIDAVQKPRLYQKLIDTYDGQSLPGMLNNILIRSHGIAQKVAERAAETFRESCEFAGILQNGIIKNEHSGAIGSNEPQSDRSMAGSFGEKSVDQNRGTTETSFELTAGVRLIVPTEVMSAFALGEFAAELKALRDKLEAWAEAPCGDNE